ncbi:MAG: aspartyl/glutamyl-tRNA amidotransferase subunit C [Spirochaetia bacterium]|nr:aspartyl/glutamyl-tRNA amidotransferase subunit C [Spirochaetia bacterium]
MSLSKNDLSHTAKLANLELTEKEAKEIEKDLSAVLEFVSQLQEVEIDGNAEKGTKNIEIKEDTENIEIKEDAKKKDGEKEDITISSTNEKEYLSEDDLREDEVINCNEEEKNNTLSQSKYYNDKGEIVVKRILN